MSKTFELWDTGTRNLIGAYRSEADALAFVREYIADHGTRYPATWVLLWDDDAADTAGQIAEGQALLERAAARPSATAAPPRNPERRAV